MTAERLLGLNLGAAMPKPGPEHLRPGISDPIYTAAMLGLRPEDQVWIARTRDSVAGRARDVFAVESIRAISERVPSRMLFVFCARHFGRTEIGVETVLADLHGNAVPFTPGWKLLGGREMLSHARVYRTMPHLRTLATN